MSLCLDGSGRHCQCQPDDASQPDESRYCDNPAVARTMKWYEETLRRDAERYRWLKRYNKLDGWNDENIDRDIAIEAAVFAQTGAEGE